MGVYLDRWQQLTQTFETDANKKRPLETVKKALIGTVAKSSGVTPVLKDIEAALEKKQRKPLEQAINKLMVQRSSYCLFLGKEQAQYPHGDDIWMAYQALIKGLEKIEMDAGAEAKALQEEKGGKPGIEFFALEGDLKGTLAAAKKGLTPHAALEKKYGLLKKADASLKEAEAYTKAAARTQYKEAREALESFKTECGHCVTELAKVLDKEKEANFHKELQSYHDAMKALSVLARINAQINNLKKLEQAG
jgi:bacterioferritin-associated ferredoxin